MRIVAQAWFTPGRVLSRALCIAGRAAALGALVSGLAHAAQQLAANFADLTLEQLGNIEITSVSKRAERLADAPASVFVITADDIRRSGATTLPEALRLAPNVQVARADASQYAITARGYNSVLANKMLVMIDGRTVYSPLFSGVFWEAQDTVLEDIERIEVISGPGGTLWGSNAVNGIISVTTRSAHDTQGTLVAAGAGNRHAETSFRYGGELSSGGHFRLYGKLGDEAHSRLANGAALGDAWDRKQVGFRADWGGAAQSLTLQGDAYNADIDQSSTTRKLTGYNLLGRWGRQLEGGSSMRLQAYYDRVERDQPGAIRETLDTFDVEFQHGLRPAAAHNVLWGAGYRYAPDRVGNLVPLQFAFRPNDRTLKRSNVFVQDEIALRPSLHLTLGIKLEHNEYTGWESLPNARLAWKAAEGHLVWGALSRAVRAPSRIDREAFAFSPLNPSIVLVAGGPNFDSEIATVSEIGYRGQASANLAFSVTAYHRQFDRLRSIDPAPGGAVFVNKIQGRTNGLEAWGTFRVSSAWRLNAGIVQQRQRRMLVDGSTDIASLASLGNDPSHWWLLRSSWDIGPRHEFDMMVRHVGSLPSPAVPGYTAVDARLGWRVRRDLELSLAAQNLLDRSHPEWGLAPGRAEIQRGVFAKALWRM